MKRCFRLNAPDVSAEAFDGEIIAINLKSGHYHSVRGVGFQIWHLLMRGCSVGQTAATLARAYPAEAAGIAGQVRQFVGELEAAQLVVPLSVPPEVPAEPVDLPTVVGEYARPVLESYTDMQELLLIDPIHEVDVLMGWPRTPGGAETSDGPPGPGDRPPTGRESAG